MTSLTRGPLPASVYWRRRALIGTLALLLVVLFAKVLGAGSDGSSDEDPGAASLAAAGPTSSGEDRPRRKRTDRASASPDEGPSVRPDRAASSSAPVLAIPDGTCDDSDIRVTPEVGSAVAGRPVDLRINLRTLVSEACTWQVSPRQLTVKITSGEDDIWSSRECPRAVPTQDVVVRREATTTIDLVWDGRRSDEDCSRLTAWAMPGYYHLAASALAGEPSDVQFELATPTAAVITRTAEPTSKPSR